jgi:hypothetical protein
LLLDDVGAVRRWATDIAARYMGADRAQEFGARNGAPGELLARLTIGQVIPHRDVAGYVYGPDSPETRPGPA